MIYTCESCGFLFHRVSEITACPRCETTRIRAATQEEAARFQAEISEPMKQKSKMIRAWGNTRV